VLLNESRASALPRIFKIHRPEQAHRRYAAIGATERLLGSYVDNAARICGEYRVRSPLPLVVVPGCRSQPHALMRPEPENANAQFVVDKRLRRGDFQANATCCSQARDGGRRQTIDL